MKKTVFLIAISLMILMSAPIIELPNALAAYPPFQSFAFINVAPHPAGLGQTVTIGMWLASTPTNSKRTLWRQMDKL